MKVLRLLHERVPMSDLVGVALMSIAAPWIAAFIHSAEVYRRGFRLYNAQIGGFYFGSMGARQPDASDFLGLIMGCSIPAVPAFLVLLPFRRQPFYRWVVWVCFVGLWTWLYFKSEIAYH